ncbi:MAG: hypothetical protein KZQ70_08460 [gamma proteobacterium symbiont of Lucinoma myriamae]|nr:hypothetical protein [gamma proteobacterium symbiont of Lucinoma myriamae]MCU7819780.1 hypothetical protein [gamma proteobacterium symbiont of Lucinoma myriamae]MCU7832521.1 hypothetical protein [gamma proteobacterium symbiont of Lucinoma myriamae]
MVIFSNVLKKILCIIFAVLISQITLAATDDDYLKQLELEAGNEIDDMPSVIDSTEGNNNDSSLTIDAPASENELILGKKKLIVDINTFNSALKDAYPESYSLYEQLDIKQQESIYQEFTKHKRLYNSSVRVISVYLSSH